MSNDTFYFFAKLAPEIRDLIWIFALPRPRLVPRRYLPDQDEWEEDPVTLQVNHESRAVALRYYKPFKVKAPLLIPNCYFMSNHPKYRYADIQNDIFEDVCHFGSFLGKFLEMSQDEKAQIKVLQLKHGFSTSDGQWNWTEAIHWLQAHKRKYPGLEELRFVCLERPWGDKTEIIRPLSHDTMLRFFLEIDLELQPTEKEQGMDGREWKRPEISIVWKREYVEQGLPVTIEGEAGEKMTWERFRLGTNYPASVSSQEEIEYLVQRGVEYL